MFTELGNFGLVRSRSQAFGFYVTYLILIVIVGVILGGLMAGLLTPSGGFNQGFDEGVKAGAIISALGCLLLTFMTLKHKNMLVGFSGIIYMVAAAALALLGGGVLGLIIPSYISTREKASG